jgi:hypothetical protein
MAGLAPASRLACRSQVEPLRLFHPTYARTAFGLPIDNLNSQFFANVYLNGLDQFVKHRLRCRHYIRYCDDFVLLSSDRDEPLDWRQCGGPGPAADNAYVFRSPTANSREHGL